MIPRDAAQTARTLARGFPIIVITGPRQSGKTTLARAVFPKKRYVTLEDEDERERALEDPRGFLSRFPDGAILDEAQRCPKLFSYLQTNVDESRRMGHFILTGSQQFGLLSEITQSLAGRAGMLELLPFSVRELREAHRLPRDLNALLWKGFYPALYSRRITPPTWYASYVTTYLERDVRQLLGIRDLRLFRTFLKLCAAHVGQIVDQVALGNACGISHVTVRHWLSVLEASYIVFLLPPYFRNFGKRLVKRPKLYFYDPGLAAFLLQIQNSEYLAIHPARGGLFESLVIADWMKERFRQALPSNAHFWRDNTGHEVDLILEEGPGLSGLEVKATQTVTPDHFAGLRKWKEIVRSEGRQASLVYGGKDLSTFQGMKVIPWTHLWPKIK